MRIVIALGGNALLKRGEAMTDENQRANVRLAARQIAPIAAGNELVIAHGNGPQIGLLALQAAAYTEVAPYPLDILGAQTEGMLGYMIEQELGNCLPPGAALATILTQVEVDGNDPAFRNPTKPIGPVYSAADSQSLKERQGWSFAADGDGFRRVVPSPRPKRIVEKRPIEWLLREGAIVICAGGGGIPARASGKNDLVGVEAVIDKDYCSGLLARELGADLLLIVTDVSAVFVDWKQPGQKSIALAQPSALRALPFPAGSMGPKVEAACEFVEATGRPAAIGALSEIGELMAERSGTWVKKEAKGIAYRK